MALHATVMDYAHPLLITLLNPQPRNLKYAVIHNRLDVMEQMLYYDIPRVHLNTALLTAVIRKDIPKRLEMAKSLLDNDAEVNSFNGEIIRIAASQKDPIMLKLLLEYGAILDEDMVWSTIRNNNYDNLKLLLSSGAPIGDMTKRFMIEARRIANTVANALPKESEEILRLLESM